jgi:hypothetical protein
MKIVRGTFESFSRLGRKHPCGTVILTFRLEDGSQRSYFDSARPNVLQKLEKHKDMAGTIWELPTGYFFAECQKLPRMAQIQSEGYERLYDKKIYI